MLIVQFSRRRHGLERAGVAVCGKCLIGAADKTAKQGEQLVRRRYGTDAVGTCSRIAPCRRVERCCGKCRDRTTAQYIICNIRRTKRSGAERAGTEPVVLAAESNRMVSLDPHGVILNIRDNRPASLSLKTRFGIIDQGWDLDEIAGIGDRVSKDRVTLLPAAANFI